MHRILILWLCCLASGVIAQEQPGKSEVKSWVNSLSVRKDPRDQKLQEIFHEITALDSASRCRAIHQIIASAKNTNTRSHIRSSLLHHLLNGHGLRCTGDLFSTDSLNAALQESYEIDDEALQYDLHLYLGEHYNAIKQFGPASLHYHLLFDILERNQRADFNLPARIFYDMSYSLYHTQDYEGCIEKGLNALYALPDAKFIPGDTLSIREQLQAWNTIGLSYLKRHQNDSALLAFNKALALATGSRDKAWEGIIIGNKGDVYYSQGQYDSAYVLLQFDYDNSLANGELNNAANSLQWIARMDLQHGQPKVALAKLRTARTLLNSMGQPEFLSNVSFALSGAFTALGQPDSANIYLQQYLHLHDSIEVVLTKSAADIVQMRMNNINQVQTIKNLNREKRHIAVTRNFTILVVLLIGVIGYLWLNRLRLKMQIRQREALEGKRIAEAEAQKAFEQLEIFRQILLEKNAIIEKFQTADQSDENDEEHIRRLSELSHHLILNEDDWSRFKVLFDSVYPGFFLSLRNKVPDITQAEQRMAALSKLKLTAREAANLLGVSPNTVYTTRRRLRQRLGLEQDADLDPYLNRG